jgi:hypothetical protein
MVRSKLAANRPDFLDKSAKSAGEFLQGFAVPGDNYHGRRKPRYTADFRNFELRNQRLFVLNTFVADLRRTSESVFRINTPRVRRANSNAFFGVGLSIKYGFCRVLNYETVDPSQRNALSSWN